MIKRLIFICLFFISTNSYAINDLSMFKLYKKPKIRAFLMANQDYKGRMNDLKYPLNDVLIFKAILTKVFNVPDHNIHHGFNLSFNDFQRKLNQFVKMIQKDELIIIFYTGHGNTDGMPLLVDNKPVPLNTFHELLNSFTNDTVLIMDSCFSSAEGIETRQLTDYVNYNPKNKLKGDDLELLKSKPVKRKKSVANISFLEDKKINERKKFRKNIIRFYSSLAHQQSKEGQYKSKQIYHSVLKTTFQFLDKIGYHKEGNGLFTLLFAAFFAQSSFQEENIDLFRLNHYINSVTSTLQQNGIKIQRPIIYPISHIPFQQANRFLLYKSFQEENVDEKELTYRLACNKQARGKYDVALVIFLDIQDYKDSKIRISECYVNLGQRYIVFQSQKAISYLNRALKFNSNSFNALNYLGQAYSRLGYYDKALSYYERVLKLALKTEDQRWLATSYNNLAHVYNCKGLYDKALEFYGKSLQLNKDYFGENHIRTAVSYFNVGYAHYSQGQYDKALKFYYKAIDIAKLSGDYSQSLAIGYNNIGEVYNLQGDCNKALLFFHKALKMKLKVFKQNHPSIAICYSNIANSYFRQDKLNLALIYYFKSLDIYAKTFGEFHPNLASSYVGIGQIYLKKGEIQKALQFYKKGLLICQKYYGENHPFTAVCYNNIGLLYLNAKHYKDALMFLFRANDINIKTYGKNHPNIAINYNNIAYAYGYLGNFEKALQYHFKSYDIKKTIFGELHPSTATSYNNIGFIYNLQKNYDKALIFYFKALIIRQKILGESHSDTSMSYNNIGVIYLKLKQYQQAEEYLLKAVKINEKKYGSRHPQTKSIYANLSTLYENMGDHNQYESYKNKSQ